MECNLKCNLNSVISLAPILINAGGTAFAFTQKSVEGAYISNFFTQVLQFFVLKYNYNYKYKRPSFCPSPGEEARMLVNRSSSPNVQDGDSADKPVIPFIVLQHVMGDFGAPIITTVLKVHQTPGHTFDDTNNFSIFALSVFVAGFGAIWLTLRYMATNDKERQQSLDVEQTAVNALASLIGVILYFELKPTPDQIQLDVLGSDEINGTITWNFQALLASTAHMSGLLNIDGVDVDLYAGVRTSFYIPCQNDDPLPINAYWVVNGENVTDFSLDMGWDYPLKCGTPTTTTEPTTTTTTTEPTTTTTEPTTTTTSPSPNPFLRISLANRIPTGNNGFNIPVLAWTSSLNPPLDEMVHFIGTSNNGLVTGVDQSLSWRQILSNQSSLSSHCYRPGDGHLVFDPIDGVSISPNPYSVRCGYDDVSAHDVVGEVDNLSNDSNTGVATPIAVAGVAFIAAMALKRLARWFSVPDDQEIEEKSDSNYLGGSSHV